MSVSENGKPEAIPPRCRKTQSKGNTSASVDSGGRPSLKLCM